MRIVYVSQYFPPEMGAPAARASELARHWARMGEDVTVLTGFPNHPTGKLRPEYRARFRRLVCRETVDGAKVVRSWLAPLPNRKGWERMVNYSSFAFSSAMTGSFLRRPEIVIGSSPQLLVALSAWWISRVQRAPFIFEVRDLWPESLAAVGVADSSSRLHRTLSAIAGFLYRNADHVVVVTPAFKQHLIEHWNVPAGKISIVSNGVETGIFSPAAVGDGWRRRLGLDGKFIVAYIGTMGNAHGLETILKCAAHVRDSAPECVFLVVGEGAERQRFLAQLEEARLENVVVLDQQPREQVPGLIAACDACLVLLKASDVFRTVIPTKMLEFMSCARPVVLGVDGQARQLLESASAGIAIPPEDPVALAEAIERLRSAPENCAQFGESGRRYILKNFSREQTARDYVGVLRDVLRSRTRADMAV